MPSISFIAHLGCRRYTFNGFITVVLFLELQVLPEQLLILLIDFLHYLAPFLLEPHQSFIQRLDLQAHGFLLLNQSLQLGLGYFHQHWDWVHVFDLEIILIC